MPADALLSIALLVCPLIGGVVTFGLQLHGLRRAQLDFERTKLEVESLQRRLELDEQLREKLLLEIDELRSRLQERSRSSRFVHTLSTEDVLKYSDIRFSERETHRELRTHARKGRPDFEHTGAPPPTEEHEDTIPLAPIDSESDSQDPKSQSFSRFWLSLSITLGAIYVLLVVTHFIKGAA